MLLDVGSEAIVTALKLWCPLVISPIDTCAPDRCTKSLSIYHTSWVCCDHVDGPQYQHSPMVFLGLSLAEVKQLYGRPLAKG